MALDARTQVPEFCFELASLREQVARALKKGGAGGGRHLYPASMARGSTRSSRWSSSLIRLLIADAAMRSRRDAPAMLPCSITETNSLAVTISTRKAAGGKPARL